MWEPKSDRQELQNKQQRCPEEHGQKVDVLCQEEMRSLLLGVEDKNQNPEEEWGPTGKAQPLSGSCSH